jgi:hypothetical protein
MRHAGARAMIIRNLAKRKDARKSDAATHPPPPAPIANL